jgi:hypothetical protein
VIIILDKNSKTNFLRSKGVQLLEGYFEFGMSSILDSNFGLILNGVSEIILDS